MSKKIFSFIGIITLLCLPLAPIAEASTIDDIKNGGICFGAGWVANWIVEKIQDSIWEKVEGFIGDTVPVSDSVSRSHLRKQTTKERNYDLIARCVARTFFDKEIFGILNIAKKFGRDGGPLHVRNWRNFQTNAQYRGERIFRAILANTPICNYLSSDLRKTFGVTARDKVSLKGQNVRVGDYDPFALRAKCTLPPNFNLTKYQQDFAGNGGWATLERLLEPQNNLYGFTLAALNEAEKQRALEISADINQVLANDGYLGYSGSATNSCLTRDPYGKCLFYRDIKAPGYYIAANIAATVNQELAWLTNADELNEVIVNIATRLANRILTFDQDEKTPTYEGDLTGPTSSVTPFPTGSPPPSSCTGGNPACRCVTEDPAYEKYSTGVSAAEDRAIQQRPDLFEIGERGELRLRPGVSPATARDVICGTFGMTGVTLCRAHAQGLEDELVLEIAAPREDVSVDFLVSDGSLWANPIAACEPGVQ